MEIGHRIKRAREAARMTQTELANSIGVSRGLVGQWESHRKKPGRENLLKIAEVTSSSVPSLVYDSPDGDEGLLVTDPDEMTMLRIFRRLALRQKKNILDLLSVSSDVRREIEQQGHPTKPKRVNA